MLTAVFLNLVYFFVIVIDAMSFIGSKRSIKFIKNLLSSVRRKDIVDSLKIPQHLAVVFGIEDLISLTVLCDFIIYCAQHGVRQLTFYDSNGTIIDLFDDLKSHYARTAKRRALQHNVYFTSPDSETTTTTLDPGGLQICALSRRHGKETLINICKELCQTSEPITANLVQQHLEEQHIYEVDFLVAIGCGNTLHNYPPWSLRLTEIFPVDRLENRDQLNEKEFHKMLRSYSSRDRRMGY